MTLPIILIRLLVFVQFSGVRMGLVGSVGEPNLDKIVIVVKVMTIGGNKTVAVSECNRLFCQVSPVMVEGL